MLNIEITETKNFVKKLLMEPVFDTFLLVEAYVRTDVSYTIDGRLNPSFFDTEELEEIHLRLHGFKKTWEAANPFHCSGIIELWTFNIHNILHCCSSGRIHGKRDL